MRAPEASHQGGHYSPGETHTTAVHCTKTKVNITPETPGETTVPKLYQKCANICTMPWFYQDNLQKCKLVTPQYSVFPGITWCWYYIESIAPGDPRTPAAVLLAFIWPAVPFFFVQLFRPTIVWKTCTLVGIVPMNYSVPAEAHF